MTLWSHAKASDDISFHLIHFLRPRVFSVHPFLTSWRGGARGVASGGGGGSGGPTIAWPPGALGHSIQLVSRSPKWGRPPQSDLLLQKPITTNVIYILRCPPPPHSKFSVQGPEFLAIAQGGAKMQGKETRMHKWELRSTPGSASSTLASINMNAF